MYIINLKNGGKIENYSDSYEPILQKMELEPELFHEMGYYLFSDGFKIRQDEVESITLPKKEEL